MQSLQGFLDQYGYIALFIGTFLEGETVLLLAGFLASRGYLDLPRVVAIAFLGASSGHICYYFLGRWQGTRLLFRSPFIRRHYAQAKKFLDRYGALGILITQFLYGARIVSNITFGALGMPPRKYIFWELAVALFWASLVGSLGYGLGETLRVILGDLKHHEKALLLYLLAGAVLYGSGHLLWKFAKAYRTND